MAQLVRLQLGDSDCRRRHVETCADDRWTERSPRRTPETQGRRGLLAAVCSRNSAMRNRGIGTCLRSWDLGVPHTNPLALRSSLACRVAAENAREPVTRCGNRAVQDAPLVRRAPQDQSA